MRLITDLRKEKLLIEQSLLKFGCMPEHDYDCFLSNDDKDTPIVFVDFGEHRGALLQKYGATQWKIFAEILAPESERAPLFLLLAEQLFASEHATSILVEFEPPVRKSILALMKMNASYSSVFVLGSILERYRTPLINLSTWDPQLNGSSFSNLRKAKRRFLTKLGAKVVEDLITVSFEEISSLLAAWKNNRTATDRAYDDDYRNYFKNGMYKKNPSLALRINGKLCAVASGWKVPNTNNLYLGISLHDYSIPELGDVLNVLFFDLVKEQGYAYVDFGSSDVGLYNYKKKFGIEKSYATVCFYVRKKKSSD